MTAQDVESGPGFRLLAGFGMDKSPGHGLLNAWRLENLVCILHGKPASRK